MYAPEVCEKIKGTMVALDFHVRCGDCGKFLAKKHWARQDDREKRHALCPECFNNYDDPNCM